MKYTYLVKYNYFGDNCGGYIEEFLTINNPINTKESLNDIVKHLGFEEPVMFELLGISLMDIQLDS